MVEQARAPAYSVRLTHPDRVLWPEAGIAKQDLADYYAEVWPSIRPHIVGRPLALVRCPEGVGECFYAKHPWAGLHERVERHADPEDGEELLVIRDLDGLIALVQAGVLEIHPWGSRIETIEMPDVMTFDLDPGPGVELAVLAEATIAVRDRLAADGLKSFVKTSGGKGFHVAVPLAPEKPWSEVKAYAKAIAESMAAANRDLYVATATKAKREGRIFVDYLRNGRGATAVAAFSTRARPGAPVSTPIRWDELRGLRPDHHRVTNVPARLAHLASDPWAGYFESRQILPATQPEK